jgi:hypothetical protein
MMNDRIIELMEQASAGACHDVETNTLIGTEIERFAELIVQECAGVDLYWLSEQDRKAVAEKIKQHFGVQ